MHVRATRLQTILRREKNARLPIEKLPDDLLLDIMMRSVGDMRYEWDGVKKPKCFAFIQT